MIADLATLPPDDAAAVLAELDAEQRRTVERLLQEVSGIGLARPPAIAGCDTSRLSSWIAQRLQPELLDCVMTAHARETLRSCATSLYPAVTAVRAPGLFARLAVSFAGGEAR
jgi:hypothetical protein